MKTLGCLFLGSVLMIAMFVRGEPVPLERLLQNVGQQVRERPNDAQAHYLLGRLHSLAFSETAHSADLIPQGEGKTPLLGGSSRTGPARPADKKAISAENRKHFVTCLHEYKIAIELKPDEPLYHYSLAWMFEQGDEFKLDSSVNWNAHALSEYRKAYDLAEKEDLASRYVLLPLITTQAGEAILRLRGDAKPDDPEAVRIRKALSLISEKGVAITPVIFSVHPNANLSDLVSAERVDFDLDGFGDRRRWSWLRADTAVLVWDPARIGKIVSGRQLFGSVTWWMFWRDGYEPLAALDDNRDGWLSGVELKGIAVWLDRNQNGISDPGEVVPAEDFGIQAIAVKTTAICEGVSCRRGGIRMRKGVTLPSFDWMPTGSTKEWTFNEMAPRSCDVAIECTGDSEIGRR